MIKLVPELAAGRRRALFRATLWCSIFAVLVGVSLTLIYLLVESSIAREQKAMLERIRAVREAAVSALQSLGQSTGMVCSPQIVADMRKVAFLPDGLNGFIHAPGGKIACTANGARFDPPVELGPPDIPSTAADRPSWYLERDLGPLGYPAAAGTIAQLGDFAVAIPPYDGFQDTDSWLSKELLARGAEGRVWSIAGEKGLHQRIADDGAGTQRNGMAITAKIVCTEHGVFCVASRADLMALAHDKLGMVLLNTLAAGTVAWVLAGAITAWIGRRWSFEERFKRGLTPSTLVLAYQPIVEISTGEVISVEVLARWRDVDGTIVAPDRFIPLVAELHRTQQFTRMVIDRAFEELSRLPLRNVPLHVNFNVFSCDFHSRIILGWLSKFRNDPNLRASIELAEKEDVDLAQAQRCIETLAGAGVLTFIDDFGTGYSNIERIARLPVYGVKLDRSFAMAPPGSVMGRMLVQVIEMIKTSGYVVIVEGVETISRLQHLQATGMVDCVQGYVISQPLQIDDLAVFLTHRHSLWDGSSAA